MTAVEIRCLCGAVRIELRGEPLEQFYCHCDDCQAVSGGAYIGVAVFPSHAVKLLAGKPVVWKYKVLPRARCPECGTHLLAQVPGLDQVGVKANLLPRGMFRPKFHIQCRYALAPVKDELAHYAGFPARFGGSDETVGW